MQTYSPLVSEHFSVISVERLTDPDFWITDDKDIQHTETMKSSSSSYCFGEQVSDIDESLLFF